MDESLETAKEGAWREVAAIDAAYARGELDDDGWHAAMAELVVPAYLSAETAQGGSGHSGTAEDWEYSRGIVAEASRPRRDVPRRRLRERPAHGERRALEPGEGPLGGAVRSRHLAGARRARAPQAACMGRPDPRRERARLDAAVPLRPRPHRSRVRAAEPRPGARRLAPRARGRAGRAPRRRKVQRGGRPPRAGGASRVVGIPHRRPGRAAAPRRSRGSRTGSSGSTRQARGRFFAIPGRRGKPAGVGSTLRRTSRPSRSLSSSAPRREATCAT